MLSSRRLPSLKVSVSPPSTTMNGTQREDPGSLSSKPPSEQHPEAMAPITLLPPELLSEIFLRARNPRKAPYRQHIRFLSQVDRHWRSVALDTPQLWTTIITSHPFKETSDPKRIAISLERAKALPITFVLRGLKSTSIKGIVEVLKAIGPSIDTMYFEGGGGWPSEGAFKSIAPWTFSFPRLRRIKCSDGAQLLIVERHFLYTMPALEQVSLDIKYSCHWAMIKAFSPWLTHLKAYTDKHTITQLFLHARALRYCSLATSETSLGIPQPFQHDTLRSLCISTWRSRPLEVGEWVPSFPKLEHLMVFSERTPAMLRLMRPSSGGLRYLQLCATALTLDEFAQCLAHMPVLRFLYLYEGVLEGYINALVYDPGFNPIVPRLEVLSISGIDFKPRALWEFASSRARGLEPSVGDDLDGPPSALTLDVASKLSAMHIREPPPTPRALWYIKLSDRRPINALRSRFGQMVSMMRETLGVTLRISGETPHRPQKDAMDLLGLDVFNDSHWDWKATV